MYIGSSLSLQSQHISHEWLKSILKIAIKNSKQNKTNQKHLWFRCHFIAKKVIACSPFYCLSFGALFMFMMFCGCVLLASLLFIIFHFYVRDYLTAYLWSHHFAAARLRDNWRRWVALFSTVSCLIIAYTHTLTIIREKVASNNWPFFNLWAIIKCRWLASSQKRQP